MQLTMMIVLAMMITLVIIKAMMILVSKERFQFLSSKMHKRELQNVKNVFLESYLMLNKI